MLYNDTFRSCCRANSGCLIFPPLQQSPHWASKTFCWKVAPSLLVCLCYFTVYKPTTSSTTTPGYVKNISSLTVCLSVIITISLQFILTLLCGSPVVISLSIEYYSNLFWIYFLSPLPNPAQNSPINLKEGKGCTVTLNEVSSLSVKVKTLISV